MKTRIILLILLLAFTAWYIKQSIDDNNAKSVESFVNHSEIK